MTGRMFSYLSMTVTYFACLILFSGCGARQVYEKKYYVLNATRQAEPIATQTDSILDVRRFAIDSAFSGKGLVYRKGEFEYESDFYNEYLVSPTVMITDKTRNWLSQSGLFKTVLDVGSQVDPTYVIEGNVTALYGDFRDKSSPKATIEIRIFLLKTKAGGESVVVFGKEYQSSVGIESEGRDRLVEALDKCLENILVLFEKDLIERVY